MAQVDSEFFDAMESAMKERPILFTGANPWVWVVDFQRVTDRVE
ncbi:hypothetical protein [Collimonas fungivorans]|uniref:Uncharacterized protein n=1 Tax=Collimonas fungivorans (strain Ter331) TaxID=1005048 RepID=G0AAJ1_COLFT|nr:hypothetical protein [Collimonas fungivorans]AEK63205.1 hypothetical protein CFU_3381 [Collimonas fungivorans Ter331]